MSFKEYYKQVSRKVDLSTLDMSADEVDEVIENAYKTGMSVRDCVWELGDCVTLETPNRFMVSHHD